MCDGSLSTKALRVRAHTLHLHCSTFCRPKADLSGTRRFDKVRPRAGEPLPPLTNWIPGELRAAKPSLLRKLGVADNDPAVTGSLPKPPRV